MMMGDSNDHSKLDLPKAAKGEAQHQVEVRRIHRWVSWSVETVLVFTFTVCFSVWVIEWNSDEVEEYRKAVETFAPMELVGTYLDAFDVSQFVCVNNPWKSSANCTSSLKSQRYESVTVFSRWWKSWWDSKRDDFRDLRDLRDLRSKNLFQRTCFALLDTVAYVFFAHDGWGLVAIYVQLISSLAAATVLAVLVNSKWGTKPALVNVLLVTFGTLVFSVLLGFLGKWLLPGVLALQLTFMVKVLEFVNHRIAEWIVPIVIKTYWPSLAE
jgi:hypothetical protein